MPRDTRYGVFELGMNHAGEIAPLSRMVRPHVAVITTVEPAHIEFFASVEAIADAKAEIFDGLSPAAPPSSTATTRISTGWPPARKRMGVARPRPSARRTARWARLIDCRLHADGSDVDGRDRRQAAALSHGGCRAGIWR